MEPLFGSTKNLDNTNAEPAFLRGASTGRVRVRPLLACALLFALMITNNVFGRVWYVNPDGTGQAPNIQAAIDSCSAGDTVLAASGTFQGEGNHDIDFRGKAIVVRSEHGRDSTFISEYTQVGSRGFFFHSGEDSSSVLEGFSIHCEGDLIECNGSSPTVRDNYLGSVMGPGLILSNSSSRIIGNYIYCWGGGPSIHCISDSSMIVNNTIRAGSDGVPRPIVCDNSFNQIIGNDVRSPILCTGGSYEISGNRLYVYQFYAADQGATPALSNSPETNSPDYCAAIWCSSCKVLIENNLIRCARIACDSSDATIRGNTMEYSYRVALVLSRGTYEIEGNTITTNGYDMFGTGIYCSNIDSTTSISGNMIVGNDRTDCFDGIVCHYASPKITHNVIARNGSIYVLCGNGIVCDHSSPTIIGNTIVANNICPSLYCGNQSSPLVWRNVIADNTGIGICVADGSCNPLIRCNDVFNNPDGNYAGIPDQTGLNGNISADPIFCDFANGDYRLHVLSSCLPQNQPDSASCGLIGALGQGCDYIATLLQEYHTVVEGTAIRIVWRISEAGSGMEFFVLRAEMPDGPYEEMPAAVLAAAGGSYEFFDASCEEGATYRYRVDVLDEIGRRVLFETDPVAVTPLRLALDQNYPNPFNPTTRIAYTLPAKGPVSLEIYDARGARIAVLESGEGKRGVHAVVWNGVDERGKPVASGVYFCRLAAGKNAISRKLVLLK